MDYIKTADDPDYMVKIKNVMSREQIDDLGHDTAKLIRDIFYP